GHGGRQRVLSLLALALAVLLPLSVFVAYGVVGWYGLTQLPDCAGPRCPPSYWPLQTPVLIGVAIGQLSQYTVIRRMERGRGGAVASPFVFPMARWAPARGTSASRASRRRLPPPRWRARPEEE